MISIKHFIIQLKIKGIFMFKNILIITFTSFLLCNCTSNNIGHSNPRLKSGIFPLIENENALNVARSNRNKELKRSPSITSVQLFPIYFDTAQYKIRQDQIHRLDLNIKILNKYKNLNITVIGYCDSDGSVIYNRLLGYDRATSVRQYMYTQGISLDRMTILSGCPEQIKEYSSIEKQKARRVDFSIVEIKK